MVDKINVKWLVYKRKEKCLLSGQVILYIVYSVVYSLIIYLSITFQLFSSLVQVGEPGSPDSLSLQPLVSGNALLYPPVINLINTVLPYHILVQVIPAALYLFCATLFPNRPKAAACMLWSLGRISSPGE